jgi:hypothetical protein
VQSVFHNWMSGLAWVIKNGREHIIESIWNVFLAYSESQNQSGPGAFFTPCISIFLWQIAILARIWHKAKIVIAISIFIFKRSGFLGLRQLSMSPDILWNERFRAEKNKFHLQRSDISARTGDDDSCGRQMDVHHGNSPYSLEGAEGRHSIPIFPPVHHDNLKSLILFHSRSFWNWNPSAADWNSLQQFSNTSLASVISHKKCHLFISVLFCGGSSAWMSLDWPWPSLWHTHSHFGLNFHWLLTWISFWAWIECMTGGPRAQSDSDRVLGIRKILFTKSMLPPIVVIGQLVRLRYCESHVCYAHPMATIPPFKGSLTF